jgi:hypothetical protein
MLTGALNRRARHRPVRPRARTLPFALTCLVLLAPLPAAGEIPPILYANWDYIDNSYPTWVRADAAFTSSGELIEKVFHPLNAQGLRQLLALPPDPEHGCIAITERFESWVNPPDRGSLRQAVLHSELIFRGEVVDRAYGFDRGWPGQLLRVEPREVLLGKAVLDGYYFFVPVGTFQAGSYELCKTDYRYPEPPGRGDEVVLMLPYAAGPDEAFLDLVWETSILVLHRDGAVGVPARFDLYDGEHTTREPAPTRRRVLALVRAAVDKRTAP